MTADKYGRTVDREEPRLVTDGGRDINPVRGPRYRYKNGSCEYLKPRTIVKESERKTQYCCPGCNRALNIDWHDDQELVTDGGTFQHEQNDLRCRSCSMRVWAADGGLLCMRCGKRDQSQAFADGGAR